MIPAPPYSRTASGTFSGALSAVLKELPFALVLLAAALGSALVPSLYRSEAGLSPKKSTDSPSPEALELEKTAALAALENNPEDIDALTRLAFIAYQEGPEKALDCIEYGDRALTLGALDARLFHHTAACYEMKGLTDYAAQSFEKYLRHRPGDLETRLRLGNLYYRMDELEKAEQAFKTVLAERPGDSLVSFNLAVVLRDRRQWKEGLDVLSPILEKDKSLPSGGFRVLGDLYHGVKDLDRALEAYREEIKRSPDDPDLLGAAAQVHEDAGRTGDSLATWKRVLDLSPRNKQAYGKVRSLTRKLSQESRRK